MESIKLSNKDKIKGLCFPIEITEELAYLVGVLAGDGNICVRNYKNDYRIKCVGDPKKEVEFYNHVLKPIFKKIFNINIDVREQDSGTTYGFYIYSKALVEYFTKTFELPIGKKYDELKIPTIIRKKDLMIPFIRGLADTDFCVTYKKKNRCCIAGASKSKRFMKEIADELKKLSFKFYEVYDYKVKDIRFKAGYFLINRIEINSKSSIKLWTDKIGFWNPRNINKIKIAGVGVSDGH